MLGVPRIMSDRTEIAVSIPADAWAVIARIAREHGTDGGRVLSAVVTEFARRQPEHERVEPALRIVRNDDDYQGPQQRALLDHDDVARLHGEGLNDTEIARQLGFGIPAVRRIRAVVLGLPVQPRRKAQAS